MTSKSNQNKSKEEVGKLRAECHKESQNIKKILYNILSHHETPLCDECKNSGFALLRQIESGETKR